MSTTPDPMPDDVFDGNPDFDHAQAVGDGNQDDGLDDPEDDD